MKFEEDSYKSHEKHLINKGCLNHFINQNTIDYWRHNRMYNLMLPLLKENEQWLTVGDGIGNDANWLLKKRIDATASDISDFILKSANEENFISKYSKENAENISYDDNYFDYVLCKQAYHHFPRPYIAVYEMLRVCKKGIVLIEPIDIAIQMPVLIFLKNLLDRISPDLINKIWKNRYSFEEAGNYVYKISEREIEKIAMGINLPYVAFKGLNDYYTTTLDLSQPLSNRKIFRKVKTKIWIKDLFCKLGIIPFQFLCAIIFKQEPEEQLILKLKENGYKVIKLRRNPYLLVNTQLPENPKACH